MMMYVLEDIVCDLYDPGLSEYRPNHGAFSWTIHDSPLQTSRQTTQKLLTQNSQLLNWQLWC